MPVLNFAKALRLGGQLVAAVHLDRHRVFPLPEPFLEPTVGFVTTPDAPDLTITGDVRITARVRLVRGTITAPTFMRIANHDNGWALTYRTAPGDPVAQSIYRVDEYASTPGVATSRALLTGTAADALFLDGADVYVGALFTDATTPPGRTLLQALRSDDQGATWTPVGTGFLSASHMYWPDPTSPLTIGSGWRGRIYWAAMTAINRAQLVFPGVFGNYLSVPDAANLDITDDIEIVARIAPTSYRPAVQSAIMGKYTTTANQRSFTFAIGTSGQLVFTMSTTGGDFLQHLSNVLPANSLPMWIKVTRVRSTGAVNFYTAPDAPIEPTTWTNLGPTGTIGVGVGMFVSTAPVEIGAIATGLAQVFAGLVRRVIIRNAVGGAVVLDVAENDAGQPGTFSTFVARSGQTVTVNQTGAVAHLNPSVGTVVTADPGVLPNAFTIVWSGRHSDTAGFPVVAGQYEGADPRSWFMYRTPTNGRVYYEVTPTGAWATRVGGFNTVRAATLNTDETLAVAVTNSDASGRRVMSSYVRDPVSSAWSLLSTIDAGAGAIPFDVTTAVRIGNAWLGRLYSVEMRTGLDPTGAAPAGAAITFPGVIGNYLSAPNPWTGTHTGVEVLLRVSADWRTAVPAGEFQGFMYLGSAWGIRRASPDQLQFYVYGDDGQASTSGAVLPAAWTNGQMIWLRATKAPGAITFQWAPDSPNVPSTWTDLRAPLVPTSAGVRASATTVSLGTDSAGGTTRMLAGRVARAIIRDGIGGTPVLDVAEEMITSDTVTSFLALVGGPVSVITTAGQKVLQPAASRVLWRFDASEFPGGAATSYVDPRGRTWTLSAAGAIAPALSTPIVRPQPDSTVWRFDANDWPPDATSIVDADGRTWSASNGDALAHPASIPDSEVSA